MKNKTDKAHVTHLEVVPPVSSDKSGWPWTAESVPVGAHTPTGQSWPKISIVTPSFNQGQFIEETIRSVLLQGYPNLEYIIIDGGSTDNSVEIIKKYEPWISYWISEPDRGQAHALNKGFSRATGDILSYLNSDDLLTAGTLAKVVQVFGGRLTSRTIACFAGLMFGVQSEEVLCVPSPDPKLEDWLSTPASLFQPSTFWTRSLHAKAGGFNETLTFCFDKDFFVKCVFQLGVYIVCPDWIASRFRLHDRSKTSSIEQVMWKENRLIWSTYKNNVYFAKRLQKERSARIARERIHSALRSQHFFERSHLLVKAALAHPSELRSRFYLGAWKKIIKERLATFFPTRASL